MERPEMTEDQREIVVVMLANALRKDAHLRARDHQAEGQDSLMYAGMAKRRSQLADRYVQGMRDLLRVLFPNGHALAEECLEEAYARAMGVPGRAMDSGGDSTYQ